jgi:hypothetical protein
MQIVISPVVKNEIPQKVLETCSEIRLRLRGIYRIDVGNEPVQLRGLEGTLWITQANDFKDHILQAGESLTLEHPGRALVQGLPWGTFCWEDVTLRSA